jgi:type I restriction enzyme R subunit
VFSELLKEAIEAAEAMFDHPGKQYTMFKDLEEQVSERNTPGVPDRFTDQPRAKAYYGLLLDQLNGTNPTEDMLVEEATYIETVVIDAVQSHSISPGNLEAAIKKGLLVRYFNLLGGTDAAYALIDQVLAIVRAGSGRDTQ